jgi:two-component system LytT family sensor kinase
MMTSGETPRWRLSSRELLFIFAFWTFLATLSSVNRVLDPRGFGFRMTSPAGPIALEYIESWLWAVATPLVFWLSSRFALERSTWMTRIPLLILIGIVMAIAVYAAIDVLRPLVYTVPRRGARASVWRDIANFRFVNELLFYFAILAAGYARVYFLRDREQAAHSARLQAQLAEARLDALRMQINPHFLFNTLHAISAMVDRDPSGVRKMIARLSDLLRHTIESRGTDEIPLRQELEFLDRYIEIMEIRFQGRLRVVRAIDEGALDGLVPNLILQPIVENALEHGVSRAGERGMVEIGARRSGDRLVITVRDNGPGVAPSTQTGVGLGNTRARLEQLYGDAASFSLRAGEGGGAIAEIVLPYRHV